MAEILLVCLAIAGVLSALVALLLLPRRLAAMLRREAAERAAPERTAVLAATPTMNPAMEAFVQDIARAAVTPVTADLRKVIIELATFVRGEIERAEARALKAEARQPLSTAPDSREAREQGSEKAHQDERATIEVGQEQVQAILKEAGMVSDPPSTTRKPDAAPGSRERLTPPRRQPGVTPGSAPVVPPEPGILAAGLKNPKSVRPLPPPVKITNIKPRTPTLLGGTPPPPPPVDLESLRSRKTLLAGSVPPPSPSEDRTSDDDVTRVADRPQPEALGLVPARASGNEKTLLSMPAQVPNDRKTSVEVLPGGNGT